MTKKQLLDKLLANGFEKSHFNTCNDWGFGGGVGDSYKRGEVEIRTGAAYYRHLPSEPFFTVNLGNGRQDVLPKYFEKLSADLKLK